MLRPDGYLGYRGDAADVDALTRYLKAHLRLTQSSVRPGPVGVAGSGTGVGRRVE